MTTVPGNALASNAVARHRPLPTRTCDLGDASLRRPQAAPTFTRRRYVKTRNPDASSKVTA
jgi:hypothetical protein